MDESILNSVKKMLNLQPDYTVFDLDIIMHINSVFSTLHQLGVGPTDGFEITDNVPTWDSFTLGDVRYNMVKSYVYKKVRLVFDPPSNSFTVTALEKQIAEDEWRLNVIREGDLNDLILLGDQTYDGGTP